MYIGRNKRGRETNKSLVNKSTKSKNVKNRVKIPLKSMTCINRQY